MHPVFIRLTPPRIAEADRFGRARRAWNQGMRSHDVNHLVGDDSYKREIDILGARSEQAGRGFLWPAEWHALTDIRQKEHGEKLPDLVCVSGLAVDVKGRPFDWHDLIAPIGTVVDRYAYLLVTAEQHPRYQICGWLWGHELRSYRPRDLQPGRPCHIAAQADLRDPRELLVLARPPNAH